MTVPPKKKGGGRGDWKILNKIIIGGNNYSYSKPTVSSNVDFKLKVCSELFTVFTWTKYLS